MKSFGIGCLHFSIRDNQIQKSVTVLEYVNEISKVLEKLSTISQIEVSYDSNTENEIIDLSTINPKLQNGEFCYPYLDFFTLKFNIYIPYRIQAKIINTNEEYLDTHTEHFKVSLIHNWYGPVSFIECISSTLDTEASTAVRIIREYLSNEINKIDTFLIIDFLGPTPFHADFYLIAGDRKNEENNGYFELEYIRQEGYDKLIFKYDLSYFSDEDIALEILFDELENEAAFFYSIHIMQVRKIKEWGEINDGLHSILDFEDVKSKKTLIDKFFKRPKLFRQVFKNIGLFKGQEIFDKSNNKRDYSSIYVDGEKKTYLKAFLDKEILEPAIYPIEETIELLKYFDQKTSKTFELTIIFMTTILGGIVGALITALLSNTPSSK